MNTVITYNVSVPEAHQGASSDESVEDRVARWFDAVTSEPEEKQSVVGYVTTTAASLVMHDASVVIGHRLWSGNVANRLDKLHELAVRHADITSRSQLRRLTVVDEALSPVYRYPFMVGDAERRLEELTAAAGMPTLFAGDDPDEDPPAPLSSAAVHRARQILQTAAGWGFMPAEHVSIFPMPNGGLQLQRSGPNSSISIEIPPDQGDPILAEFASNDEYWSKEIRESADVARFLNRALR